VKTFALTFSVLLWHATIARNATAVGASATGGDVLAWTSLVNLQRVSWTAPPRVRFPYRSPHRFPLRGCRSS
jgi:hypothetical protein